MPKEKSNTNFKEKKKNQHMVQRHLSTQLDEVLAPLSGDFIVKLRIDDRCGALHYKASGFYPVD